RSRARRVMASCSARAETMSLPTGFWFVRKMPTCMVASSASAPELGGGEARPLRHRGELGPGDLGLDEVGAAEGGEAAIAARDHPLAPHHLRIAHDPLGHQLRVLDEIGGGIEHAGNDHL